MAASDSPGEVIHCPNCKEDVPKTLYCLNCGYPLYKDGTKVEPEKLAAEPVSPPAEKAADQDDVELAVEPEETPIEEATKPSLDSVSSVEIRQEALAQPEQVSVEVPPEQSEPKASQATVPTQDVIPAPSVGEPPQAQPESSHIVDPPSETPVTVTTPTTTEATAEVTTMIDVYEEKAATSYVPDPLTKDLMESLAKNLALRLKLLSLYRDGKVREETFTKLFEGYAIEGEALSRRREELLTKLNAELEEVELGYANATEAMELLEIKKSIGDVSEGEYAAKAPAFKWDIDTYDFKVAENRNRVAYLENLPSVFRKEELQELRQLASLGYNTVDALQISKEGSITIIKASLYEAIKILG